MHSKRFWIVQFGLSILTLCILSVEWELNFEICVKGFEDRVRMNATDVIRIKVKLIIYS